MDDDMDRADAQAYEILTRTIAYVSAQPPAVAPTGQCHNCGEKLPDTVRFCDKDCAADWEKRTKR